VWGTGIVHASMLFACGGWRGILFCLLWFFGGQSLLVYLARSCFGRLYGRILERFKKKYSHKKRTKKRRPEA
jgi:hypothetical protein